MYSSMTECRVFILVVGLERTLLCMLMQENTPPLLGHASSMHVPSVDAVYIDRGRALLLELKAQDLLSCNLEAISSIPSLQCADSTLISLSTHLKSQWIPSASPQHSPSTSFRNRKFSDPSGGYYQAEPGASDSEEDLPDTGSDWSSSPSPHRSHSMLHLKRPLRQKKLTPRQRRSLGRSRDSVPQLTSR